MIEEKCHLCEKTVVKLIGEGQILTEKLLCSDCIDKLEEEAADFVKTINTKNEEIKELKKMIDNRLHWSDLKIDNH